MESQRRGACPRRSAPLLLLLLVLVLVPVSAAATPIEHIHAQLRARSTAFMAPRVGRNTEGWLEDVHSSSSSSGGTMLSNSIRRSVRMLMGIHLPTALPNPFQLLRLTSPVLPAAVRNVKSKLPSSQKEDHIDSDDGTMQPSDDVGAWGALASAAAGITKVGKHLKRKKRVMLLMSDTGGGHRASAQALQQALDDLFPGQIECSIVDIWTDHAVWPFNTFVPAYKWLAKNPVAWRAFWEYGKFPVTKWGTQHLTNVVCHENFRACIEQFGPDMIVSVHPLCQDIPLRVLKQIGNGRKEIPFATVVTDLGGAHPTWFHKDADVCFVPSDAVRKIALSEGLKPDQIRMHGLPVRPGFWKQARDKLSLRKELGLHADQKTVLVMGGGDGIGRLDKITFSLAESLSQLSGQNTQMVVVCGKNEKMQQKLIQHKWPANVNVVIHGFVSNMDDWMGASDCIVTKAGPGTIAESMTRGLPMVLSSYLPGQEAGNVPYVVEGGFGSFTRKPDKISATISEWFSDETKLGQMSDIAKTQARPDATYAIARDLGDILFGHSKSHDSQVISVVRSATNLKQNRGIATLGSDRRVKRPRQHL